MKRLVKECPEILAAMVSGEAPYIGLCEIGVYATQRTAAETHERRKAIQLQYVRP